MVARPIGEAPQAGTGAAASGAELYDRKAGAAGAGAQAAAGAGAQAAAGACGSGAFGASAAKAAAAAAVFRSTEISPSGR